MPRRRKRSTFGRVFERKGRPGFYVRVRIRGRETTRWAGPDRKTANELLARLLRESAREDLLGERAVAGVTLGEARDAIWRHFEARYAPSTIRGEAGRFRILLAKLGNRRLDNIDRGDVEDLLTGLRVERDLGRASVNRYLTLLSRVFEFAVAKGWARKNPTRGIRRGKEAVRAVPFLSAQDIGRLEDHALDDEFRGFIRLLADTGLRSSEARRLQWRDIDLRRGSLTVRKSKTQEPREVPLTARVADLLDGLRVAAGAPLPPTTPVWPVLSQRTGQALGGRFARVASAAGFHRLRLHDLRHGFCSRLAQAGVPLPTVGQLAGHRRVETTQRYASHLPEGATVAAVRRLEFAEQHANHPPKGDRTGDQAEADCATA